MSDVLQAQVRAIPPLNVVDHVLVFATDRTQPIPWEYFNTNVLVESGQRSDFPQEGLNPLFATINRYLMPGPERGSELVGAQAEEKLWTRTDLQFEVHANTRFGARSDGEQAELKEYTLSNFDIRPYLPDNKKTALYRVLIEADKLTARDIQYKQHTWSEPTEEANLRKGIDCSRAIWYVFKKAGLPYNKSNSYLTTASMVSANSPMSDYFDSCNGKLQMGDVLVYRDTSNTRGHTVMVVDPDLTQRIAWGSHGYDSSAPGHPEKQYRGAEFQQIRSRQDWQRWDRIDMRFKSCWRYRDFDKELKLPGGEPGMQALSKPCDSDYCLVR
jgi:hypothetical protein